MTDDAPSRKALLRRELLAARAARGDAERSRAAVALATHGLAAWRDAATVAAYVSFADEPPTQQMLDGLRDAGVIVLLPVIDDERLDWAAYSGAADLATGPHGIPQPTGQRLGPAALATADVIVVPALAVDSQGRRLGRGRGYYDRTLVVATARSVAVVYDEELLPEVPDEPHDIRVAAALTPRGITSFSS